MQPIEEIAAAESRRKKIILASGRTPNKSAIAKRAGISRKHFSQLINGKVRKPSIQTVNAINAALAELEAQCADQDVA